MGRPGEGLCAAIARTEKWVCATGTAYGLLKGQPAWVLMLYWLARHAVYFAVSVTLFITVPGTTTAVAIGVFFVVVHAYKMGSYIAADARETRELAAAKAAAKTADAEMIA
ncbi:hypothetical protein T492DRAFT_957874 [Pavlovales sp. CCMP2436]|nr:hypothetical protein T492DRAFT_957874 [Pavlovales sp. CCMP2436]|mmetsp:Transcript_15485/g.39313  ORF Transcript_15485/g.39313 Transcript_15485/m.39313 type:complete len:111 (+) Transcript_15485:196-528(+)